MRLFPRTTWGRLRLAVLLLAAFLILPPRWWAAQARYASASLLVNRVRDHAGVLTFGDEWRFERFLQQIDDESGVDLRFLLVPEVTGETLEGYSVRQARALGVGRDLDRRGLLFVYDVAARRLRIEIGGTMEGVITDAFAGYLMREHVRSFFGAGNPSLGLRTTLFIVQHRLREAVLGQSYDPRVLKFIADARRLALGGGASTDMRPDARPAFLNVQRTSDRATRTHFAPQPSPEMAYTRYLEWLARGGYQVDVPLFTPQSQEYMAGLSMTRGFNEHWLTMEYGHPYRIDTRGDLALLYFTTTPLLSPHFFRRTAQGWVIDIVAEVLNTRNYSGFWYTWGLLDTGDDFSIAFADRYVSAGGMLRVLGGDNRPMPSRAFPSITLEPAPDPADSVAHVTVEEAASRIDAGSSRVLVLLYHVWSEPSLAALPALGALARDCRASGVEVLAFMTDQERAAIEQLPRLLRNAGAPFSATHLRPWPSGHLTSAMAPLGIRVGSSWAPPIIAMRVGGLGVVAQIEGLQAFSDSAAVIRKACSGGPTP
jgi:hypothetical protein